MNRGEWSKNWRAPGCDAETPTVYVLRWDGDQPVYGCRCIVCSRCGRHTGNATQGHYWSFCKVSGRREEFHHCCPRNCELHAEDRT